MELTFSEKIIHFNERLAFDGTLPDDFRFKNPFRENGAARKASQLFYRKYYRDHQKRNLLLGINPGRFGAGYTGVPFTDPKRLIQHCQIAFTGEKKHEPSSVFIYDMIAAYGGVKNFYRENYIHSVCPLALVKCGNNGKEKNANYYDRRSLTQAILPFIEWNIREQIKICNYPKRCFCIGSGKNFSFLLALNQQHGYFDEIIPLEHPRFIMQYKSKEKDQFIKSYLKKLRKRPITS